MKMKRKLLSLLLTLCMVLTMLPGLTMPAAAADAETVIEVHDFADLQLAFDTGNDAHIRLMADVSAEYYSTVDHTPGGALVANDPFSPLSDILFELVVAGKKTLDLNGHSIDWYCASRQTERSSIKLESYLFNIQTDARLHVLDSAGGGRIRHHATLSDKGSNPHYFMLGANVFYVEPNAELVIDGGEFVAGRSSKKWVVGAYGSSDGYGYYYCGGIVVDNHDGKVVINDGSFTALHLDVYRHNFVFKTTPSSTTIINGGKFFGDAGAGIFSYYRENSTLKINGGTFDVVKRRCIDFGYSSDGDLRVRLEDREGVLGVPYAALNPQASFRYDGKSYQLSDFDPKDTKGAEKMSPKWSKKTFEVIPGAPIIRMTPEVKDDNFIIAQADKLFPITAVAEPYFKDIGMDRKSRITFAHRAEDGTKVSDNDVYSFQPQELGVKSYLVYAYEFVQGELQSSANHSYTTDIRSLDDVRPNLTVQASHKSVSLGTPVTLTATCDQTATYQWYHKTAGTDVKISGATNETYQPPTDTRGVFPYFCTARTTTGITVVSDTLLISMGVEMPPIIGSTTLYFKYGVHSDFQLPHNPGGESIDQWSHETSWNYEGTIPEGLTFTRTQGFSGTPRQHGNFPIQMTATNDFGTVTKAVTIVVTAPIVIANKTLPVAVKGEAYSQTIGLERGTATMRVSAGTLPEGLTLDPTGVLHGTVTGKAGTYPFTVQAEISGEAPATQEYQFTVHAKPKFENPVLEYSVGAGTPVFIASTLTEGSGTIKYSLTDAPTGLSVTNTDFAHGAGHIIGDAPDVEEQTYEFSLTAKNEYGEDTLTIRLIAATKPITHLRIGILPMGEVGVPFSSGDNIYGTYTKNTCKWFFDRQADYPVPSWMHLNEDTGEITGTPDVDTGVTEDGKPKHKIVNVVLKDTVTGLQSDVYVWFRIAAAGGKKAATDVTVSDNTLAAKVLEMLFLRSDAVPDATYTLTGGTLPPGMTLDEVGLITGAATEIGSYTFQITATNEKGSFSKELTLTTTEPVQVSPPTLTPAGGTFPKGSTVRAKFNEAADSGWVGMLKFSVNGGKWQDWTGSIKNEGIPITDDTVIRAYYDTLGMEKRSSEVASFAFTFANSSSLGTIINITTAALPDGAEDQVYPPTALQATTTDGKPLTWSASGLPAGMTITGGTLGGTPTEFGAFTVKLTASTENGLASKTLPMSIAEKVRPLAAMPTISAQPHSATYKLRQAAAPLSVTAAGHKGLLWYRSGDNSNTTPADDTLVGTGASYTPTTTSAGKQYYYVSVTNSEIGKKTATLASNVATITVTFDAATPTFTDMTDNTYTYTAGTDVVLSTTADEISGDGIAYKWYEMKGTAPNPTTDTAMLGGGSDGELMMTVAAAPSVKTYYAVATNTDNSATGSKTASAIGPKHIVTSIAEIKLTGLSITAPPSKIAYTVGETFTPAGMEVTAHYSNRTFAAVTGYTYTPTTALTTANNTITITYTKDAETFSTAVAITVTTPGGGGGGGSSGSGYTITKNADGSYFLGDKNGYTLTCSGDHTKLKEVQVDGKAIKHTVTKGSTVVTFAQGDMDRLSVGKHNIKLVYTDGSVSTTVDVKWNNPFTDVKAGDWFYGNVAYVHTHGIMEGISNTLFAPDQTTTRGMLVTMLHRLAGSPATGEVPFTDVKSGSWYENAVAWAAGNKLVNGYGNGRFGPEDPLSREQMVTILYNYAKFKGVDVSAAADLSAFKDCNQISTYAQPAMKWAVKSGIIQGISSNLLSPASATTRAQIAAIFARYMELNAK